MPPALALILCIAFVLFLLRLDRRRSKDLSHSLWIPALWMLYCASKPFPDWFENKRYIEAGLSLTEGSPLDRRFLTALIIAGLLVLLSRNFQWPEAVRCNQWLFLLFLYMLVSISWSDYPFVSLKRWFKVSGTIIMALIALSENSPLQAVESLIRRTAYVLIPFSVLIVKYYPFLGVGYGRWSGERIWEGASSSKNTLGILCAIAVLFLVFQIAQSWRSNGGSLANKESMCNIFVVGMALWLMKGPGSSFSATSFLVLLIGLGTFWMLKRHWIGPAHVGLAAGLFLCIATLVLFQISNAPLSAVASIVGRDATLTGRTDSIWSQLTPIVAQHPLVGLGYGGFWVIPLEYDKFSVNQAHNGYLDITLELGIVGFGVFGMVMLAFFRKASREFQNDVEWGSFRLSFFLISLFHNFTESSYVKSTAFLWSLFVLLFIVHPRSSLAAGRESSLAWRSPKG